MREIALVACSKTKAHRSMPAAALYTSALFRKSLLAALGHAEQTYILSAKHGLVGLNDELRPYEKTLKTMSASEKSRWGDEVLLQLTKVIRPRDVVTMYCGEDYIAPLRKGLTQLGCRLREPLRSQSLGQRLQSLRASNREASVEDVAVRFASSMRRLWKHQKGGRLISECNGRTPWPDRGVYFFLDPLSDSSKHTMPRITRVGTHAVSAGSRTSLWNRLSTHRGVEAGGGSHRSSIFRLHVGRALMKKHAGRPWPATWGAGQDAPASVRELETHLEGEVSKTIGRLRVIWLDVGDEAGPSSDRAYLERNAIGLLSRTNILASHTAGGWLGLASPDWRIAASGLWNLNHLFIQPDPAFIDVLEHYVEVTVAGANSQVSVAPRNNKVEKRKSTQQDLFAAGGKDAGRKTKAAR